MNPYTCISKNANNCDEFLQIACVIGLECDEWMRYSQ